MSEPEQTPVPKPTEGFQPDPTPRPGEEARVQDIDEARLRAAGENRLFDKAQRAEANAARPASELRVPPELHAQDAADLRDAMPKYGEAIGEDFAALHRRRAASLSERARHQAPFSLTGRTQSNYLEQMSRHSREIADSSTTEK